AEDVVAQRLGLPSADVGLAVKLGADVVFLHAIAVDEAQGAEALASEIVRQVRAERAGAAQCQADVSEPGERIDAAIQLLVIKLARHRSFLRVSLAQHADQTLQVETPILTAEANARRLNRQIALFHRGDVPPAVDFKLDAIAVLAFEIASQPSTR